MNNPRAINMQPLLIVLTIGATLWGLSTGSEGLVAGVAAWLLVAGLCILLTMLSIRARRYVSERVRQAASETGYEVVQQTHAAKERRDVA